MRFFRRNRNLAWLALFALSAQLALTFGHVHLHTVNHSADVASSAACSANTQSPCPAHDDGDDDAHCPLCWSIAMAGTLVVPAVPVVDLPPRGRIRVEPLLSVGSLWSAETVHFQARAPPLV